MDCHHYTTELPERKRGQHLQREERGVIQALKQQGLSNRAIARALGCSPTTIGNELRRGTPSRKSSRGRSPGYNAKRGEAVYRSNRLRSRKPHKLPSCEAFVSWMTAQVRENKWSLDACVGYAKRHGLFPRDEIVCTRTLYHEVWAGNLPIGIMELPEVVKRKHAQTSKPRENKKNYRNLHLQFAKIFRPDAEPLWKKNEAAERFAFVTFCIFLICFCAYREDVCTRFC